MSLATTNPAVRIPELHVKSAVVMHRQLHARCENPLFASKFLLARRYLAM